MQVPFVSQQLAERTHARAAITPAMGRHPIWLATLVITAALTVHGCGPEALCILEDGSPASNAFGAQWCERDGLPGPTRGDTQFAW